MRFRVNLERHLNAYSVIGVGRGWRMLVMLVTPVVLLGIIAERGLALTAIGAQLTPWHVAGVGVGAGLFAVLAGISLASLPGRRLV